MFIIIRHQRKHTNEEIMYEASSEGLEFLREEKHFLWPAMWLTSIAVLCTQIYVLIIVEIDSYQTSIVLLVFYIVLFLIYLIN